MYFVNSEDYSVHFIFVHGHIIYILLKFGLDINNCLRIDCSGRVYYPISAVSAIWKWKDAILWHMKLLVQILFAILSPHANCNWEKTNLSTQISTDRKWTLPYRLRVSYLYVEWCGKVPWITLVKQCLGQIKNIPASPMLHISTTSPECQIPFINLICGVTLFAHIIYSPADLYFWQWCQRKNIPYSAE